MKKISSRLVPQMHALPEYRGWQFSYEYPGLFHYSHPDSPFSIFFTPDYVGNGTLPISVQDSEGRYYDEHSSLHPLPRTGRSAQKIFSLVRPTLDKLLNITNP